MALDQGVGSRAIIFDSVGQAVAVAQSDIDLIFPQTAGLSKSRTALAVHYAVGRQLSRSGLAPSIL